MTINNNSDDEKEETYENQDVEQKKWAEEIADGDTYGAIPQLPKTEYEIISTILRMNFPRKILEEKIMKKKAKFTPYMVQYKIHGFEFIYFASGRDLEEFGIDMVK